MAKKLTEEKARALSFHVTEAYRKARTSLVYSIIKKGCKKIVFTSPHKGEGKTTTAINIAAALAQQVDCRVLIIDCDLRRPSAHTRLSVQPEKGLAHYLNNECQLDDIIVKTSLDQLDLISYGEIPPNPSELLSSEMMSDMVSELEKRYDFIIFDTPPVISVADVIPLIGLSDGMVLVIRHNSTTYPELDKAVDSLKRNNAKIIGMIVNKVPTPETSKGGYYVSDSIGG